MMESVECRDMFQLHIVCKDSKVIRYLVYCCAAAAAGCDQLCAAVGTELSVVRVLRLGAVFLFLAQSWLDECPR